MAEHQDEAELQCILQDAETTPGALANFEVVSRLASSATGQSSPLRNGWALLSRLEASCEAPP